MYSPPQPVPAPALPPVLPLPALDDGSASIPAEENSSPAVALDQIRVLHVVNGEHFSGAERVQSHLGRCLPGYGIQADFASVKAGRFAEMVEQHQGEWGNGYRIPMTGRADLRAAFRLRKLIRKHRYQILHAHTPRSAMVTSIAARLTGVPWVYHVHSPASRDSTRSWTNRANALIEKVSLHNCNHVITVSESLRSDCILAGVDQDRITVVHNGVPSVRPPRESAPQAGGNWKVGMIALMRPRKGLEIMLQALAQLKERNHGVTLRIIGPFETEDYRGAIETMIARLDLETQIERVGYTDNVPAELAKLDAMVLPSLFGEGLPMVVLEAMAAAVPVIATRVEGTPEAVTHGVEGLLAEPGDPISLANEIESLVTGQHDWNTMSEMAVATHRDKFSDQAMASRTANVYRRLLDHEASCRLGGCS